MPTYDYACDHCGHSLEVFQRMVEAPLTVCPECEEPALKRQIGTGAGIIFKGGGFYETDFKDKKGAKSSDTPAQQKEETPKKTDSSATKTAEKTTPSAGTGKKSD